MRFFIGNARLPFFASFVACAAILTVALAGCGGNSGGDDGDDNEETPSLIGTWRQVTVASDDQEATCPGSAAGDTNGTAPVVNTCTDSDTFTFADAGKFTANVDGVATSGDFVLSSGNLRLTVSYPAPTPTPTPTPTATPDASPTPTPTPTPLTLTNSVDIDFEGTDEFTLEYESNDVRFRDTFQRQITATATPTPTPTP